MVERICTRISAPSGQCREHNLHCAAPACFAPIQSLTQDKDTALVERVARAIRFRRDEAKSPGLGYVTKDSPLTAEETTDARAALSAIESEKPPLPSEADEAGHLQILRDWDTPTSRWAAERIRQLEEALRPFAEVAEWLGEQEADHTPCPAGLVPNRAFRRARTTLDGADNGQ